MAKPKKQKATFDWAACDERLHAACVAVIGRFAAEHPGEAACFFALGAAPFDNVVHISLGPFANNVRVVKAREAAAVSARDAELRREDAYKGVRRAFRHAL